MSEEESGEGAGQKELDYFVSAKPPFLVVSFKGAMSRTTGEIFERCQAEVIESGAKFIVLSFHDVTLIERPIIPTLVKLQKSLRDSKLQLRTCYLKPEFRKLLVDMGAIRSEELAEDLQAALTRFAGLPTE